MKYKCFFWSSVFMQIYNFCFSLAFADNCGSPSDCWNTLAAAVTTAVAVAAAAALAAGLAFKDKKAQDEWLGKLGGQGLTEQEKEWIKNNLQDAVKIGLNKDKAIDSTMENYPNQKLHNNEGDAFRHFVWSALNARDIGVEKAREYGNLHENFPKNPIAEKEMDTWNNEQGFDYINSLPPDSYPDLEDIENEAKERIKQGKLKWL